MRDASMKKVLKTILLIVVYMVLVSIPSFLGYLSPMLWVCYPVVSAFLCAAPVMLAGKRWLKFGAVCIFPLIFAVLMIAMGEITFVESIVAVIAIPLLAELVRGIVGYGNQKGLRISYAIAAVAPALQLLPLWTCPEWYYAGALEEMGSEDYANSLMAMSTPFYLILLIVLTLIVGWLGAVVAERIFKCLQERKI